MYSGKKCENHYIGIEQVVCFQGTGRVRPAYAFRFFSCHSWLLDETLLPLVGVYSNISFFQQRFQIVGRTASNAAARYVLRWDIQPDEIAAFIPQNRFQSNLKERLLAGQQFYEATGLIV